MTTITIDRALLEQALEALEAINLGYLADVEAALRAALAQEQAESPCACWPGRLCSRQAQCAADVRKQQAEPVQEPYTDDVTRIMREAGMTFHLGLPHKAVVEQMTRVVDLVYAEASIKAAQQFAAAPPQRKPLTDEEIDAEWQKASECAYSSEAVVTTSQFVRLFTRAVERAHGIGGQE